MPLTPDHAHALLSRVDPGRLWAGRPVGLRDGALLALVAAGLSSAEIAALRASAIEMAGGRLVVTISRDGRPWPIALPIDLGARLLAWLTECRLWGDAEPVFRGQRGPLTPMGVRKVLCRYSNGKSPCEPSQRRSA